MTRKKDTWYVEPCERWNTGVKNKLAGLLEITKCKWCNMVTELCLLRLDSICMCSSGLAYGLLQHRQLLLSLLMI